MKNFKGTLIALVLLAGLGLYIGFFEKGPAKNPDADQGEKLFNQAVADVVSLSLDKPSDPSAKPVSLVSDDKGIWKMVSPEPLPTDENAVRNLLNALTECHIQTDIKDAKNLADFGLNSPTAHGLFRFKNGRVYEVWVGNKNVNNSAYYIRVSGRAGVQLVPNDLPNGISDKVEDLRDRTVFAASEPGAQKLVLTTRSRRIVLEKASDGKWSLTEPTHAPAAVEMVRQFLTTIDSQKVADFADDHPSSLQRYGLAHPSAVLEIWPVGKAASRALLVGSADKKDKKVYVKDRDLPYVYRVNPDPVVSMENRTPGSFRSKDVMQFTLDQAVKLVLHRGAKTITYNKTASGAWSSPERPTAAGEASGLLAPLSTTMVLEYRDWGPATGLDHPDLTAEVTLQGGQVRKYRYGKMVDKDKVFLASDQGRDALVVGSYNLTQLENVFKAPPAVPKTTKK